MKVTIKMIVITILSVMVASLFVWAGGNKLSGSEQSIAGFQKMGFPFWFVYFIGFLEVIGAVMIVIPKVRAYGAGILASVMIGAIVTHIVFQGIATIGFPLAVFLVAVAIGWFSRPHWFKKIFCSIPILRGGYSCEAL